MLDHLAPSNACPIFFESPRSDYIEILGGLPVDILNQIHFFQLLEFLINM